VAALRVQAGGRFWRESQSNVGGAVTDSADLSDEELATIQGVVRDGALLLDQDVPDWATKVPTDERFDMQSEDRDILGWVYGSFQHGMDALRVDSADLYGFDFPDVQVSNSEETSIEILIEDDSIISRERTTCGRRCGRLGPSRFRTG
jgi:hypothetical protein